jgi:phytoene dehydrogenase-like protein
MSFAMTKFQDKKDTAAADVVIVGAGHNGLSAALFLARAGLKVTVVEEKPVIGGATRTEKPFAKAPNLGTSTGAYLLGVMPPELIRKSGARLKLIRRDPHYFLPTLDGRYLLFGSDRAALREQFLKSFSEQDWKANEAMNAEIAAIRDDLGPSWLEEPLGVEATAERYIRPALRRAFVDLVSNPVDAYLARFGFESELIVAMYAITDGFSGLSSGFGSKGTGFNFLVHNMCRLPGADGTYMIAEGGMGTVAAEFARLAAEAGAEILVNAGVERVLLRGGRVEGVALKDGRELRARVVVSNADPFRMRRMVGAENLPAEFNARLDRYWSPGTTMKINLALDRLPVFKCLPENRGQHNGTIHLIPSGPNVIEKIRQGYEATRRGELAEFPTMEWYIHTQADPTLKDEKGRHNSALFIQWVPNEPKAGTWDALLPGYVDHLFDVVEQFAPGFKSSVVDTFPLSPKAIEEHFGMSGGHIHHVDNSFILDERMPYRTPVEGLYACGAGCHPAGSVSGASGHNAAMRVLKDLGVRA